MTAEQADDHGRKFQSIFGGKDRDANGEYDTPPPGDEAASEHQSPPPAKFTFVSADELMRKEFPEPRWAVPNLIPEGLSLLVGAPKMGKSWLALATSIAVASGGRAVGKIAVDPGDALYLGLEDSQRRLQERLGMILQGEPAPHRLALTTIAPTLADGATAHIRGWLASHPDARLVVIDTFQRLRGPILGNQNLYSSDYAATGQLKRLADDFGVAILLVHHTRKAVADDPLDAVLGTNGLAGAADSVLVLRREIGRTDGTLYLRGRDLPETDHAMNFDAETCSWTLLGDAAEFRLSKEQQAIIDLLRSADEPMSPKAIADLLDRKPNNVRFLLHKMAKTGVIDGIGGAYRVPPTNSANTTNSFTGGMSVSVSGVSAVRDVPRENDANGEEVVL